MVEEKNKFFEAINQLRLQIEHHEDTRRNTWNIEAREKQTAYIKVKMLSIDNLLDEYNFYKNTAIKLDK